MRLPTNEIVVHVDMPARETTRDRETLALRAAPIEWESAPIGDIWIARKTIPSRWRGGDTYELGLVIPIGGVFLTALTAYLWPMRDRRGRWFATEEEARAHVETMGRTLRLPEVDPEWMVEP